MGYKITTLVENCVYGRKLQAEHGLSLYIETQEHRLLFDTEHPTCLSVTPACCILTCKSRLFDIISWS